ncbi:hypothetical protein ACOMHN_013999 [Nucella lapillus]
MATNHEVPFLDFGTETDISEMLGPCSALELVIASEASGQLWSAAAWDLQTGNSVHKWTGQALAARSLCLQAGHTLIGATLKKPLLYLWHLGRKAESQQKIVCPGHISALAVSPDGLFCAAIIGEKIYIWEMTAGNLMGLLNNNDEASKIQFTDDGSLLVVATCSGLLKIWHFASALSSTGCRSRDHRTIKAHSESITDIHVGCGGPAARVVTASADGTCKLWDLLSGDLIRTVVFEDRVTSVVMDKQEYYLIAGLSQGSILRYPLYEQPSQTEVFVSKEATKSGEGLFQGHTGPVTCLALSSDSLRLVSGSEDKSLIFWDMPTGEKSSSIQLSDAVRNVLIIPPWAHASSAIRSGPPLSFKHQTDGDADNRVFNITISDTSQVPFLDFGTGTDISEMLGPCSALETRKESKGPADTPEKMQALEREIAHLKQVNKELYSRVSKEIVSKNKQQSAR